MMSLIALLTLFIASPFVLISIGLKSKVALAIALAMGLIYTVLFFFNAFSELLAEIKGIAVDSAMEKRLLDLWNDTGMKRSDARFWTYPSSDVQFKIWVNGGTLEIFFSQGLLNLATDAGLRAAFKAMSEMDVSDIKLQNRRHALTLRFDRLKGPKEDFRYWFVSFWLYPLERLLKIAKL